MARTRIQLTPLEGSLLIVTTILPTFLLYAPAIGSRFAGPDVWLSVLLAIGAGLGVALLADVLSRRFPGENLIEFLPRIAGRVLGAALGAAYCFWFVHFSAVILREFVDFVTVVALPRTPPTVIAGTMVFVSATAVRSGLEVISRVNLLFLPVLLLSLFGILLLSVRDVDPGNLLPIAARGLGPILDGAYAAFAFSGEVFLGSMVVLPYLRDSARGLRSLAGGLLLAGAFMTFGSLWNTGIWGADLASHFRFPSLQIARYLSVAGFLERMEVLFLGFWVLGNFVKLAVWYYAAATGLGALLRLTSHRPFVWPVGLVLVALSLHSFRGQTDMVDFLAAPASAYQGLFVLVIPLGLLAVATLRSRKGGLPRAGP